jgi:hypothetical protein
MCRRCRLIGRYCCVYDIYICVCVCVCMITVNYRGETHVPPLSFSQVDVVCVYDMYVYVHMFAMYVLCV